MGRCTLTTWCLLWWPVVCPLNFIYMFTKIQALLKEKHKLNYICHQARIDVFTSVQLGLNLWADCPVPVNVMHFLKQILLRKTNCLLSVFFIISFIAKKYIFISRILIINFQFAFSLFGILTFLVYHHFHLPNCNVIFTTWASCTFIVTLQLFFPN